MKITYSKENINAFVGINFANYHNIFEELDQDFN